MKYAVDSENQNHEGCVKTFFKSFMNEMSKIRIKNFIIITLKYLYAYVGTL